MDLKKAKEAADNAKDKAKSAVKDMFQLYVNLLSVNAKYPWNKILKEQTQPNPYTDLQCVSKNGPRGPLCKSFDDCMMFHFLTVFPNNAAEQERYYLKNVLKKPQRVSVHQFVQCVEQLNTCIGQLPCWFYSPRLVNVLFTEADLASHVLQKCPFTWQDQFNLHKKGMTSVDMRSLLMSLEVIDCICTQEKSNAQSGNKASNKGKKGNRQPGTDVFDGTVDGLVVLVTKAICLTADCDGQTMYIRYICVSSGAPCAQPHNNATK